MLCLSVRNLKSIVGDFVMGKDHIDVGDFCIPKSQILTICNKTVYYWQYTVIGEVADVKQEEGVPLYVTTNGVKVYAFDPTSICLTSVEPARLGIQAQVSENPSHAAEMTTATAIAASAPIVAQAASTQDDDFLDDSEDEQSSTDDDEFSIDDVDDELDSTPTEDASHDDDDDDEFDLDSLDDDDEDSELDEEDDDDFFEDDVHEEDDEDEFDLDDFDDLDDDDESSKDEDFDI